VNFSFFIAPQFAKEVSELLLIASLPSHDEVQAFAVFREI